MNQDDPIRVFIGYDSRQAVLYNVAQYSIIRHCSRPVSIAPIKLDQLRGVFDRPPASLQATEFSFSRFLTPYLSGYRGWVLFMDCDVLVRADIAELWALRDERYAVQCVKHDHQPTSTVKFLGKQQTRYEKKNWSSVMLMNCARCTALAPEYVNAASGLDLHQFKWLASDDLIGALPREWNFLAEYYAHDDNAKLVHFTEGGPYYVATRNVDFAEHWWREFAMANSSGDSDVWALAEAARRSPEGEG